tara:strand:- start:581 stop:1660 length:1080 start_codon:yes stop_codon:yes gene_type:complete
MFFINKLNNFKNIFIIIITSVLFLNTVLTLKLYAASFKVSKLEISEEFDLDFNKKKVFDKAFNLAFDQLTTMVITSSDKKKIENIKLSTIKNLIDSFNVSDEKFVDNKYYANFNVNFNKKNTLKFFEEKNIFPSIPKELDILLIPILIDIDQDKLKIFSENPIYNQWNIIDERYNLLNYLLPSEDIEDNDILNQNINDLESYDFNEIIKKYDLNNFIISIFYKEKNRIKVLSKIKLHNDYKIINSSYEKINLDDEKSLNAFIEDLKIVYEDNWKMINKINTSIKLPITVFLSSKDSEKIQLFEKILNNLDLVSDFYILNFDNKNIFYKVIYNGSPNKFLSEVKENNLKIIKNENNWQIE